MSFLNRIKGIRKLKGRLEAHLSNLIHEQLAKQLAANPLPKAAPVAETTSPPNQEAEPRFENLKTTPAEVPSQSIPWVDPSLAPQEMPYMGTTMYWELVEGVLEVTLEHSTCNEIGMDTLADLERLAALLHTGAAGARAMILYSTRPSGFSAGADLRALYEGIVDGREAGESSASLAAEVRAFLDRIHAAFNAIDTAPITTIAATHGVVFGGGFELALTCDLIVADKSTRFCFPELRLGLIPGFGGIPRLERDLGNGLVRDILLTGRSINARRAQEIGLVSQLVARGRALDIARRVAAQALRFDAHTTARAKNFVKPLPLARMEEEKTIFCDLFTSPVVEAALKKFVESTSLMPYLPE